MFADQVRTCLNVCADLCWGPLSCSGPPDASDDFLLTSPFCVSFPSPFLVQPCQSVCLHHLSLSFFLSKDVNDGFACDDSVEMISFKEETILRNWTQN